MVCRSPLGLAVNCVNSPYATHAHVTYLHAQSDTPLCTELNGLCTQASGATLKEMPEENLRRVAWKRKLNDEPPRTLDVKITFDFSSHLQRMRCDDMFYAGASTSWPYACIRRQCVCARICCSPNHAHMCADVCVLACICV